jgi:hypothetical protein
MGCVISLEIYFFIHNKNMTYFLKKGDTTLVDTIPGVLWAGLYSIAHSKGSIMDFVKSYMATKDVYWLVLPTDGEILSNQVDPIIKQNGISKEEKLIVMTLSQKTEDPSLHYFYMPLDDTIFSKGLKNIITNLPPWESRSSVAFWRGGCSGGGMESVRCRTVAKLIDQPLCDVKLSRWWSENKNIPDNYFADRVPPEVFLNYKIFFIIDGNCIASNHMWGFATGCVPFILSNAKCWFLEFVEPWKHYIPVEYDLSDLVQLIEWVRTHDEEARCIAERALQFSNEYFSSEFQKKYITTKLDDIISKL